MVIERSAAMYLGLLGLLGLERVFELWLSRRNAQRAFAKGGRELGQNHFPLMAGMHTAFLVACGVEALFGNHAFRWELAAPMLTLTVLAQGLRYWAITTLGDRWNTRIIFVPGASPVVGGPYRFMQHPNYCAVVVEMFCIPLIHSGYWTAASFTVLNALVLWVRIRAEEEALGPAYRKAFAGHRRLLPWRRE